MVFTTSEELLKVDDVDIKTERSNDGENMDKRDINNKNDRNDTLQFDDE